MLIQLGILWCVFMCLVELWMITPILREIARYTSRFK